MVEDGREAVEAYQADVFDIVLRDMQMPVMDGLAAVRAIRAFESEQQRRRTPIKTLSANALEEHRQAALAAGADDHVAKPITAERLISAVVDIFDC